MLALNVRGTNEFPRLDHYPALSDTPMAGITIYHPEHGERTIAAIDFTPAWRAQGWSDNPAVPVKPEKPKLKLIEPPPTEPKLVDPIGDRVKELQSVYENEGWSAIRAIAENLGVEKPDEGWEAAIPLIAKAEN